MHPLQIRANTIVWHSTLNLVSKSEVWKSLSMWKVKFYHALSTVKHTILLNLYFILARMKCSVKRFDVIKTWCHKRFVIIETVRNLPYKFLWNPLNHWINQSEVQEIYIYLSNFFLSDAHGLIDIYVPQECKILE